MSPERLPLTRIVHIAPLISELERRVGDAGTLLAEFGWSSESVSNPEIYVPAQMIYDFAERAAQVANDRYFAVHAFEEMDLGKWPLFVDAIKSSHSVAGCLHQIISQIRVETTAIIYSLHSDGSVASLEAQRTFEPVRYPSQIDGMAAVTLANLLKLLVGPKYEAMKVTISCQDISSIPPNQFPNGCLLTGKKAFTLSFPAQWLDYEISHFKLAGVSQPTPFGLTGQGMLSVEIVKCEIEKQLSDPDLKIENIADICGMKPHVMRRELAEKGTSFREIRNLARFEKSCRLLENKESRITEIAAETGYAEVSSFSRALKNWSGKTPNQYRQGIR
ncbi:MAG: helix-turn-helix domain-containing protein [Rhizobiaceae bacterium]